MRAAFERVFEQFTVFEWQDAGSPGWTPGTWLESLVGRHGERDDWPLRVRRRR